ncbi:hypothetical protein RHMOL_Rhmol13G0180000 [Rhododendron molle]|uniref:Uncharacterized protein n=1 Tax=Rhododendron molle TaxID=49168 RepID=A0ACC0L8V4_RHOML|nr:hypothetical protein RHMOL_Rhmol13G0180000 [Rhododendron molle]
MTPSCVKLRLLRVWFSVGIGFSLTAMLGVYVILLWESATLLHLYNGNAWWLSKLLPGSLFGILPSVFGLSTTVADVGYMCLSTIISVSAHEFGHALAAARASNGGRNNCIYEFILKVQISGYLVFVIQIRMRLSGAKGLSRLESLQGRANLDPPLRCCVEPRYLQPPTGHGVGSGQG